MSELIKQLLLGGSGTPKMPVALRRFTTADEIISRDTVEVQGKSWLVEVRESQVVRFFEVPEPDAEHCLLTYRAALKSKDLAGRAFLEMWCRLPGRGDFSSRGRHRRVQGTTDWSSYEIPFRLKKGQRPDLIRLNLVVEGHGKIWVKDVELLKMPL